MELEALIFDVDGTLADTERDGHRIAFNKAFAAAGIDWHWPIEVYGELLQVTGGKERMQHYIDHFRSDFSNSDVAGFIAELHASKTKIYTELLSTGKIPLRPGVKRLLEEARAKGLRLAISTTTTPANVEALLVNTLGSKGLDLFDVIAAGDIVPQKKPASDIYDYVLENMGLQPAQCFAFEDSWNGLQSSHGAGLRTIVTVNGYTYEHDFRNAMLVVDHLGESDNAFTVLAGDAAGQRYIGIEALRILNRESKLANASLSLGT